MQEAGPSFALASLQFFDEQVSEARMKDRPFVGAVCLYPLVMSPYYVHDRTPYIHYLTIIYNAMRSTVLHGELNYRDVIPSYAELWGVSAMEAPAPQSFSSDLPWVCSVTDSLIH